MVGQPRIAAPVLWVRRHVGTHPQRPPSAAFVVVGRTDARGRTVASHKGALCGARGAAGQAHVPAVASARPETAPIWVASTGRSPVGSVAWTAAASRVDRRTKAECSRLGSAFTTRCAGVERSAFPRSRPSGYLECSGSPESSESPRWVRIRRTTGGSSIVASTVIRSPHLGHASTSAANTQRMRSAPARYFGRAHRRAPVSSGSSTIGIAPEGSSGLARATTSARHGAFGARTP